MRQTSSVVHAQHSLPLGRGWIIVGAALASWAVFAGLWTGTSQLFLYVLAAV